jgi:GNAT superfamily N-acetyltransferase
MNDDFMIKTATAADAAIILNFIKELADYEKLSHEVVATEAMLQENLFGKNSPAEVHIAYYNNEPIGYTMFFRSFSTFLGVPGIYLEDLYITPKMRGQGFGKKLLANVAKLVKEKGYGRLEWSVLDWNKPAIDFYESIGAKPMADWTMYRLTGKALIDFAS